MDQGLKVAKVVALYLYKTENKQGPMCMKRANAT